MSDSVLDGLERRGFIVDADVLTALGMTVDDLADPETRSFAIAHEHPEFADAVDDERDEMDFGHGPFNPRLHLALHEVVATQLWDNDPPEVWETALRLRNAGYERHEVLHMLCRPVSDQIWAALHENQPYDRVRHVAALRALPETWEQERSTLTSINTHAPARKRARRTARAASRRNRRPK